MANGGNRDVRGEILDILSLSRTINTDIQETNRAILNPQSSRLAVNMVNPKAAVDKIIQTAGQQVSPTAIVESLKPPPTVVANFEGTPVAVPPPMGLIPMPEGYSMPVDVPPPIPSHVHTRSIVSEPVPSLPPPLDPRQLELELAFTAPQNRAVVDEIFLRFRRIEDKIDVLNVKISELLEMERKKYERRIKKVAERFGEPEEGSTTPQ